MSEEVVIAFDFGTKRIGVAVGQTITATGNPLKTVTNKNGHPDWRSIESLVELWQPDRLIVGLPDTADGKETPLTKAIHKFARQLEGRFAKPVSLVGERLSSYAASGYGSHRQLGLDAFAAREILETWLTEQAEASA